MRKGIKRVQLQKSRLPRRRYREDIPDDCRDCSFWLKGIDSCSRYDCFYLIEEEKRMTAEGEKPDPDCRTCPYGRERPCVGYCIKELHRENARQFADQKGR